MTGNKAFFLDRDGVINKGHSLNKPSDLKIIDGVPEAIGLLTERGYEVFVVTNQGGVGLGYMTAEALQAIHDKMLEVIQSKGGIIRDIRACIHKPSEGCVCRKPKPGMIAELATLYDVDLENSYMVGDRDVDIQAGNQAGVHTIFIGDESKVVFAPKPDYVYPSLISAVEELIGNRII
jgi:D-glycero-D-manno-heptose 1,7-bisphosphate phosphatase